VHLRERLGAYRVYLILNGAISFFLTIIFTINIVYHIESAGLDPLQLVLVGTLLETVCFLGEVPTGIVADLYSRRLSVIIGVFLIGIGFLIEGSFPVFGAILLSQVFWGLGATFMSGAEEAWIADEIGEERAGRAYLRSAQVRQLGALIGAPVSVVLASIALNVPILIGAGLTIALGVFLILVMPEHGFAPAPRGERSSWSSMKRTLTDGGRLVRRRPVVLNILAITLFFAMFSEGYDRLGKAHLLEDFTLPTFAGLDAVLWFGVISVAATLFSIASTEIVRRRVDTNSHTQVTRLLFAFDALLIGGVLGFALAGNFWLAIGLLLFCEVLRDFHYPLTTAWLNQSIDDSRVRATVLSLNGQLGAAGQIPGGPLTGYIGKTISLRAALIAAAAILTPTLPIFARALRKGAPEPVAAEEVVLRL
jgi:DHA3 family tetracycline resistance protein-like MFS transporter